MDPLTKAFGSSKPVPLMGPYSVTSAPDDSEKARVSGQGLFGNVVRIVVAAAGIAVLTVALIYLSVFVYVVVTPEGLRSPNAARQVATGVLPAAFFGLAVLACCAFLAYRYRVFGWGAALALSVLAAATEQTLAAMASPVIASEALTYLLVGCVAGLGGQWTGERERRRSKAGDSAAYAAVRRMHQAADGDEVAAAVASSLEATEPVVVAVWKDAAAHDGNPVAAGLWVHAASKVREAHELSERVASRFSGLRELTVLYPGRLGGSDELSGKDLGVRSAFVLPLLVGGDDTSTGLLFVGLGDRHATLRTGWKKRVKLVASAAADTLLIHSYATEKARLESREVVLEQRQAVADDLHDSLLQHLAAAAVQMDAAAEAGEPASSADPYVLRAREIITAAVRETRRVMHEMQPASEVGAAGGENAPETSALPDVVREHVDTVRPEMECSVEVTVRGYRGDACPVFSLTDTHELVQLVKESLTNVRKHARATQVEVSLLFNHKTMTISITDDGKGFVPDGLDHSAAETVRKPVTESVRSGGYGFISMANRAKRLRGELHVKSAPNQGTRILLELPYPGVQRGKKGS